ncbi:MAG: hypothetical protein ACI4SB_10280 [Acutalibacteraceae bacterium]
MKRIKSILKRIFILPPVPTLIICVISFSLLFYVFASQSQINAWTCTVYFLSAYSLSIFIGFIVSRFKNIKGSRLIAKITDYPIIQRLKNDLLFREKVILHIGSGINLVFALTKLVFGVIYRSVWYVSVAVYYLLLAIMRIYIIRHIKTSNGKTDLLAEYKIYRFCAFALLLINQVLTVMVAFMVFKDKGYEYTGYLIYAMAMHCFYMVISTAVNLSKFRKIGSPLIVCIKVISFMIAIVSVLSLETAMLTQFGDGDTVMRQRMVGITGVFVCAAVLVCAVYMLVKSKKEIKKLFNTSLT